MNLSRRSLMHIGGVATIVALGGGVWSLGFQERVHQQQALAEAQATLTQRRALLKEREEHLAALAEQLHDARDAAARVEKVLTSVREQNVVLGRITRIAAAHGLAVDKVEPNGVISIHEHDVLKVHVAGRGSFPDVVGYLAELHDAMGNIEVERWTVDGKPLEKDFSGLFQLDLAWHMAPTDVPEE